jgi:hypothetical protein
MALGSSWSTRFARWLREPDNALLIALIVVNVIPIWSFQFFPSQDGPSHLANARIALEYYRPDRAFFRDYYVLNWQPLPNLLAHFLLVGLMAITSPLVAEKLLLSLYVVSFGAAARYAVGALRRDTAFVALFAMVFVWNYPAHMGFYNFSLSVALYLFAAGFWLRRQDSLGVANTVKFGALVLLLYSAHLVAVLMLWITIGGIIIWGAVLRGKTGRQIWIEIRRRTIGPLLASVVPLGLATFFVVRNASAPGTGWPEKSLGQRLLRLLVGEGLISFDRTEAIISVSANMFFAGVVVFLLLQRRRRNEGAEVRDGLGVLTILCLGMYFFIPDEGLGGGYIRPRIYLFTYLTGLLWLSTQLYSLRATRVLRAVALAFSVALVIDRWQSYARINRLQAEFVSALEHVPAGSTLESVIFSPRACTRDGDEVAFRVHPFVHATGYLGALKPIVLLDNYEAGYPYFPVSYRPAIEPNRFIGNLTLPTDLLSYSRLTPGRIEYVLVWGGPDVVGVRDSDPYIKSLYSQLAIGFERIYVSPENGLVELYRSVSDSTVARDFRPPERDTRLDPAWTHCMGRLATAARP